MIRYVREFNRIVEEEVKKQKEKQNLSNKAKEGFKNFGNMLNRNKSTEEAPKERVLSDKEINERAERIAKDKLKGDEKLVSSYDQCEKIKKKRITQHGKIRSVHSSQQLTRAESKIAPIRGRKREVYALH
ncbi:hypothetical protein ckin115_08290 [Helicobacter pylori]